MSDDANLASAMHASTRLLEAAEYEKALEVLDKAITTAVKSGQNSAWIPTVCNHAALIADFAGHHNLIKHYYEQSLAHDAENPSALYGLAKICLEQGEVQLAKSYATKCYDIVMGSTDRKGRGLLDLIVKRWPELATR
jgi:Tfp pilus assembly protein PilF